MTGKRGENSKEIRAYIKGRSLLGLKPVDIHREVCEIYGEGQMSHTSVCRWVATSKFKAGQKDLTDAAGSNRPPTTAIKSNMKKITDLLNQDAALPGRLSGERVGLTIWWLWVRSPVEANFLSSVFSPLSSAEACEKSSQWLWKERLC